MADDLARAIESLNNDDPELASLDLFSLDIGDEGTEKIAFAIANNTKCVYLSLWSNNIAMKGVAHAPLMLCFVWFQLFFCTN